VFGGWLLTGAVVMLLFFSNAPALWMLAGFLLFIWGILVAVNFRGLADAFPRRLGIGPFWQETSRANLRAIFAFFALWGAAMFVTAAYRVLH